MKNNLKIATPISHLFENDNFSSQIIDLSDCLECRDHSLDKGFKKQELFHCDLQVIHKFSTDDFNYLKEIKIFPDEKLLVLKDPIIDIKKFCVLSKSSLEKKFLNKIFL